MRRVKQSQVLPRTDRTAPLRVVIRKQSPRSFEFPAFYVVSYENMIAAETGDGLFLGHHGLTWEEALAEYEARLEEISRPKPVILERLRGLPT